MQKEMSSLLPEFGKTGGKACTRFLRTFNRSRISCGFGFS